MASDGLLKSRRGTLVATGGDSFQMPSEQADAAQPQTWPGWGSGWGGQPGRKPVEEGLGFLSPIGSKS